MSPLRCKRVGHGGASAVVRGNTLESFDAAAELGVDMIEFDVRAWRGSLVLAHLRADRWRRPRVSLERALRHLAQPRFTGIELNVDVKQPGTEAAIVEALAHHRLLERSLVSTQCRPVLRRLRAVDPRVRIGASIGGRISRTGKRWGDWATSAVGGLRAGEFDALMLHHGLVDRALVAQASAAGGDVYAWVADCPRLIDRLVGTGVAGITTNDPRLFAGRAPWAA